MNGILEGRTAHAFGGDSAKCAGALGTRVKIRFALDPRPSLALLIRPRRRGAGLATGLAIAFARRLLEVLR